MTGNQIRAMRALIDISISGFAYKSGLSHATIQRAEAYGRSTVRMRPKTMKKIIDTFAAHNVAPLGEFGVTLTGVKTWSK